MAQASTGAASPGSMNAWAEGVGCARQLLIAKIQRPTPQLRVPEQDGGMRGTGENTVHAQCSSLALR